MTLQNASINKLVLAHWDVLHRGLQNPGYIRPITGSQLDPATLILVARHIAQVAISDDALDKINKGAKAFKAVRAKEKVIYGVNTGFGSSADTRTTKSEKLKQDLLNGLLYGMLDDPISSKRHTVLLPLGEAGTMDMPESWARAAMLVRINSLAHGASGVLLPTIQSMLRLLNENINPRIPLRGSISASGDLSPLAYIAGLMEGKPTVSAWSDSRLSGTRSLKSADQAILEHNIPPLRLEPREALALVNGTSMSAGLAALVMHEAIHLMSLSQVLTAMSVEALRGTDESFDPFLAHVRPHWGQAESAKNIRGFLRGSKLVWRDHGLQETSLRQDRYSIRTASQWLGPIIEDTALAHSQVITELNSVTDNPLIDYKHSRVIHGGNFQAQSITSAMEKVRQGAQSVGRMLFTQCTELINPAMSRGLPPNLVFAEPSESFVFKGIDILIASLLSELGYLANPVSSHVQTAEMGNQALNSLALISARYTMKSLGILKQLAAAHLITVCQALDLRVFQSTYLAEMGSIFSTKLACQLEPHILDTGTMQDLLERCWKTFVDRLESTTSLDSAIRIPEAVNTIQSLVIPHLEPSKEALEGLRCCVATLSTVALESYSRLRNSYLDAPDAKSSLGPASGRLYDCVRSELKVPVMCSDGSETPEQEGRHSELVTLGDFIERIRSTMTEQGLYKVLAVCISEIEESEVSRLMGTPKL